MGVSAAGLARRANPPRPSPGPPPCWDVAVPPVGTLAPCPPSLAAALGRSLQPLLTRIPRQGGSWRGHPHPRTSRRAQTAEGCGADRDCPWCPLPGDGTGRSGGAGMLPGYVGCPCRPGGAGDVGTVPSIPGGGRQRFQGMWRQPCTLGWHRGHGDQGCPCSWRCQSVQGTWGQKLSLPGMQGIW